MGRYIGSPESKRKGEKLGEAGKIPFQKNVLIIYRPRVQCSRSLYTAPAMINYKSISNNYYYIKGNLGKSQKLAQQKSNRGHKKGKKFATLQNFTAAAKPYVLNAPLFF